MSLDHNSLKIEPKMMRLVGIENMFDVDVKDH
jgi:hypothetical protein